MIPVWFLTKNCHDTIPEGADQDIMTQFQALTISLRQQEQDTRIIQKAKIKSPC